MDLGHNFFFRTHPGYQASDLWVIIFISRALRWSYWEKRNFQAGFMGHIFFSRALAGFMGHNFFSRAPAEFMGNNFCFACAGWIYGSQSFFALAQGIWSEFMGHNFFSREIKIRWPNEKKIDDSWSPGLWGLWTAFLGCYYNSGWTIVNTQQESHRLPPPIH